MLMRDHPLLVNFAEAKGRAPPHIELSSIGPRCAYKELGTFLFSRHPGSFDPLAPEPEVTNQSAEGTKKKHQTEADEKNGKCQNKK